MKFEPLSQVNDPCRYFNNHPLDESLMLHFWYDRDQAVLELVIAYAHEFLEELFAAGSRNGEWKLKRTSKPDCFQRFLFSDVQSFVRQGVARIYRGDVTSKYHAAADKGANSIERVDIRQRRSGFLATIYMGSFGIAEFKFGRVEKEQRCGVLQKNGDEKWTYRDVDSGETFPDDDPFFSQEAHRNDQ